MVTSRTNPNDPRRTPVPEERTTVAQDRNEDPISGASGAHPVGTGLGAAGAGAIGAAIGTAVGGPIGGIAGAAIGGIAGGLAGKAAGEAIDPTVETTYWQKYYVTRPYYDPLYTYDLYEPAYRYGWESRARLKDRNWEDVEGELERDWDSYRGDKSFSWKRAKDAVRDAWHRVSN